MSTQRGQPHVLHEARRRDSLAKRQRVLAAVAEMEHSGQPVTFAATARQARVSTWLVYADGVREHIQAAIKRQAAQPAAGHRAGLTPPQRRQPGICPLKCRIACVEPAHTYALTGVFTRVLGHGM